MSPFLLRLKNPKIYKKEDNPYLSNFGKNAFSNVDEDVNKGMLNMNDPLLEARIQKKMKDLEDEIIEYEDVYEEPKKEISPKKNPMKSPYKPYGNLSGIGELNNMHLPELKALARRRNVNISKSYVNKVGKNAKKDANKQEIIDLILSQNNFSL
jgi:hypothetical protein